MNTIGALHESDPSEHAPLAESIWTTTPEESGLGVDGKAIVVLRGFHIPEGGCRSSSVSLPLVEVKFKLQVLGSGKYIQ